MAKKIKNFIGINNDDRLWLDDDYEYEDDEGLCERTPPVTNSCVLEFHPRKVEALHYDTTSNSHESSCYRT